MSGSSFKQLVIGLPCTGKSTFLAALWHIVDEKPISTALELVSYPENREYINGLTKKWISFINIERTGSSVEKKMEMLLRFPNSSEMLNFIIPDLSGEIFNLHWMQRKWSRGFDNYVLEATGILLFVPS